MRSPDRLLLCLALLGGSASFLDAHEAEPSRFDYHEHIRPIFVKHCAGCHYAGGPAPMSLLEYQEAVPWANAIKMQVLEQNMPPWLPTEGIGEFRHARTLTAEEIDRLIDWSVGQTPQGEPQGTEESAAPEERVWHMGTPDLVLEPREDIVIGEDVYEVARCIVLPTGLEEPRRATAFELSPGMPTLVRRATIFLGPDCRGATPLATWLPGEASPLLPGDRGHEIPAGASVAVEVLYVKGWNDEGKRLVDRSALGVRFAPAAREVEVVRVDGERHRFDEDVELLALFPDPEADVAEEPLRVELVGPGGTAEPLLVIEEFSPQWREKYVLQEPLTLERGSSLRLSQPSVWIDVTRVRSPAAE